MDKFTSKYIDSIIKKFENNIEGPLIIPKYEKPEREIKEPMEMKNFQSKMFKSKLKKIVSKGEEFKEEPKNKESINFDDLMNFNLFRDDNEELLTWNKLSEEDKINKIKEYSNNNVLESFLIEKLVSKELKNKHIIWSKGLQKITKINGIYYKNNTFELEK